MTYKINFILIIISFLISCKAPQNAINTRSIPESMNVMNVTDSLNKRTYEQLNTSLECYLFESQDTLDYLSYFVVFVDDTIESINAFRNIYSENYFGSTTYRANTNLKPNYSDSSQMSYSIIPILKKSIGRYPIIYNKKGHKYDEIVSTYHTTMNNYFQENYTLFYKDTLNSWNKYDYSRYFDTRYGELQSFLEHSIAYYRAFPEKMATWPVNIRQNMIYLGQNLNKTYLELSTLQEDAVQSNEIDHMYITSVLMYLKSGNADEFRSAQRSFYSQPTMRWFYMSKF